MASTAPPTGRRGTTLADVLAAVELPGSRVLGDARAAVTTVAHDSRAVVPGTLFCCVPGHRHDGHTFAADAVAAGATALLVDHELVLPGAAPAQVIVPDVRAAMGLVAAAVAGHPSQRLRVVGITGTNGKTTTVSLLAAVLRAAGRPTEIIGTLTGSYTTPEAPELQVRLAGFVADGTTDVAMEVSSHALVQHRVDGTEFAAGVFTNLGHDHLDLHGTRDAYFEAKCRLFEPGRCALAVVNAGDEWGRRLLGRLGAHHTVVPYAIDDLDDVQVGVDHHRYRWRGREVRVPLGGHFNVANSLAAATTAAALDVALDDIVAGLAAAPPVPGRFEAIASARGFTVVVDYAHTPDGLHAVIDAARRAGDGARVIVVFGCGGERDHEKRPAMGAVVAAEADLGVVTSDNPRSEDPLTIIEEIVAGIPEDRRDRVVVEPDRRTAIGVAFRVARPGDVVVVAGKGHETTQTVGGVVLPFDDRVVVRDVLETLP